MITRDQLQQIMTRRTVQERYVAPLNEAMERFEINTTKREAAFIAQLAHESGEFHYMEELASGSAYDHRDDLGNTDPVAVGLARIAGTTPGRFYKGHGPIQITGYYNHMRCGQYLGLDLVREPRLLCQPTNGFLAAGWFWHVEQNLNPLADEGDFETITRKINGGMNGYDDRLRYWEAAKEALGC